MTYRFTLQAIKMECLNEQVLEWGKDEMHLFGFGISRKGNLIATGYRGLGSYSSGDVKPPGVFPITLYDAELENDGLDVLFYFWFVEEDGGGVRKAATNLEAELRAAYLAKANALTAIKFPRECIPFTAFYKAVLPFEDSIQEASTDGLNDELYIPVDLLLRFEPDGPTGLQVTKDITVRRSKKLGDYLLTLRYTYSSIQEAIA
ncbi:MAG: hypothetical protein K8S98_00165 [Planctomycetes bacterium]|nr:hypothetical protein [Planctomycetota bacterium]